jgi:hypothetical protein
MEFAFAFPNLRSIVPGMDTEQRELGFWDRVVLAWRMIFNGDFARRVARALAALDSAERQPQPAALPPERAHAAALFLLSALQREGRIIDFLQQDVAAFSDEEVGAAARVVHAGSRKIVQQYFTVAPIMKEDEGASVSLPKGFDAQRVRLTGNVAGEPPFRGTLKHHGWFAAETRMPQMQENLDPRVIAPAEVEL